MKDDASSLPSFPTGATVPFPYENPYPQQVDFMEAILQALRRQQQQEEETPSSASSSAISSNGIKKNKRRAKVLFLESPTGTGKSLSLACASVAWLRYKEQQDLSSSTTSSTSSQQEEEGISNNNSSSSSWWDDWKSPEQREEERMKESVRLKAIQSRLNLQKRLQHIAANTTTSINNNSNSNNNNNTRRRQQRRDHVIRLAISEAKRDTTAVPSSKTNKRPRNAPTASGSAAAASFLSSQQKQKQDFCLEDYRSDTEENHRQSRHSNMMMDDYGGDDDAKNNNNNNNKSNRRFPSLSLASTLLDGAALDGSSACCTTTTTATTNTAAAPTTMTVGQTFAGSGVRKIVYAARTHTQLSQFVSELKRTAWGKVLRVVALAGRKILCSNNDLLSKYKSEHALNEACLDMQKSKSKSSSCQLKRPDAVSTLALHTLAQPTDVEEASELGKSCQACAYYASRVALPAAEVVVVPYSMLLSKSTRKSIGLSLQQTLVLVDEAHNLPEALRSMHSCRLTLPVVEASLDQLSRYLAKYQDRLAGRNLHYLGQLRKMLLGFQRHLKKMNKNTQKQQHKKPTTVLNNIDKEEPTMVTADELLRGCKLENVNLFKLRRYLEHSRLSQKLLGFTNFATEQKMMKKKKDDGNQENDRQLPPSSDNNGAGPSFDGLSKHVSAMSIVETFLEKLTLSSKQGKFVTEYPDDGDNNDINTSSVVQHPTIRYVLLKPSYFFQNVLQEAHAVALVGGTLRPFVHVGVELLGDDADNYHLIQHCARADEYMSKPTNNYSKNMASTSTLGGSCPPRPQVSTTFSVLDLTAFTCDHVVPPSNVLLQLVSTGPNGRTLDFRHGSRFQNSVCDELGRTILHTCKVVPSGVVVFLPSYSYEAYLSRRWRDTGLWLELSRTKKLYREPKSAQDIETSLQAFSRDASANKTGNGALLFSVIGGKLSEGINFSGELCRCVIIAGLPYPDFTAPELREKMESMDAASKRGEQASITGQAYYHNLCMRSVNQAAGRAIRSANDYAAILLADCRYRPEGQIWSGLPLWLRRGYNAVDSRIEPSTFEQRQQELKRFFDIKR